MVDPSTLELVTGSDNPLGGSFGTILVAAMLGSIILTLAFLAFWIFRAIRRQKVENAILEIRDILKEIHAEQKLGSKSSTYPASKTSDATSINPSQTP